MNKKTGHASGSYFMFDRLFYLMNTQEVKLSAYLSKYEISRSVFFRDLTHLRDFYDIEFKYDTYRNIYVKQ